MVNLHLQELSFSLFTNSFNPTIYNPRTLLQGGVIQPDWNFAEEPVYSDRGVKLVFTNQVRIVAQSNRITFAETIGQKNIQDILLPQIVQRNLQTFSNLEYRAVSVNPSGYAPFASALETKKYLAQNLLSSAPWQTFQDRAISGVGLKLVYPYKTGNFYLDINQANVEISQSTTAAIWFAGNFYYQLIEGENQQQNHGLLNILQNWQSDVANFQDFINQKLLNIATMPSVSLFPL